MKDVSRSASIFNGWPHKGPRKLDDPRSTRGGGVGVGGSKRVYVSHVGKNEGSGSS